MLKTTFCICLTLIGVTTGCAPRIGSTSVDREKMQGAWRLIYQQASGRKIPDEKTAEVCDAKMVFTNDRIQYTAQLPGFDFEFVYQLHTNQNPKAIDLQVVYSLDKRAIGSQSYGIYLLEGRTLKICHSKTKRPITFEAGEGTDNRLIVLRRNDR
jgi:uncharacterized protein (TIGR03067 family)